MASLVEEALVDAVRGDASGVPLWMRDPLRLDRPVAARGRGSSPGRPARRRGHGPGSSAGIRRPSRRRAGAGGHGSPVARPHPRGRARGRSGAGRPPGRAASAQRDRRRSRCGARPARRRAGGLRGQRPARARSARQAIASDPAVCPRGRCSSTCWPRAATPRHSRRSSSRSRSTWRPTRLAGERSCWRRTSGRCARTTSRARRPPSARRRCTASRRRRSGASPASLASIAGRRGLVRGGHQAALAAGGTSEAVWLYVELVRSRHARGDVDGAARPPRDGRRAARGLAGPGARGVPAAAEGAGAEADPERRCPGGLAGAGRHRGARGTRDRPGAGARAFAGRRARALAGRRSGGGAQAPRGSCVDSDGSDAVVTSFLGRSRSRRAAITRPRRAPRREAALAATHDAELAAALHLEAAFERWRAGDRKGAMDDRGALPNGAPDAARMALAWASRGVDVDTLEGRRRAIERALAQGTATGVPSPWSASAEVGRRRPDDAAAALASIEQLAARATSGSLPHWRASRGPAAQPTPTRRGEAIIRIAARGPRAPAAGTGASSFARARSRGRQRSSPRRRRGGSMPAAGSRRRSSGSARRSSSPAPEEEKKARLAVAGELVGDAREAMIASAALLELRIHPYDPAPLLELAGPRRCSLANLELSPPGSRSAPARYALTRARRRARRGCRGRRRRDGRLVGAGRARDRRRAGRVREGDGRTRPRTSRAGKGLRAWGQLDRRPDAPRARRGGARGALPRRRARRCVLGRGRADVPRGAATRRAPTRPSRRASRAIANRPVTSTSCSAGCARGRTTTSS